jgi:hypothetical protein
MEHIVLLFGEAEKGQFCRPTSCRSLPELLEVFGNPPAESQGLFYAIQALLFQRQLIYYRVEEEGFSITDYKRGMQMLRMREFKVYPSAICMPGVGDAHLIDEMSEICFLFHSLLITTERDLYDYLTH